MTDWTDMFVFGVWSLTFLIVMVKLFRSIRIVPQRYAMIVERLGKYHVTLKSGFHILIPFIDKVTANLDLKEQTIEVPPQECFTKDEIKVIVDGLIYISVTNAVKAHYGITNFQWGATQLAQTTTRAIIGKIDLDRTFEEREAISQRVVQVLAETGSEWGIQVHRYEIKNIQPPRSVQESMEKQVRAERERRAILAKSEGDKQARINRSEGYKTEIINTSEGEKQKRINEAEGRAAEIKAIADAMGLSIEKIATSIASPGGKESVKLGLTEQYLDTLGTIAKQEPDVLLPIDLSNFKEVIASLGLEEGKNP